MIDFSVAVHTVLKVTVDSTVDSVMFIDVSRK